PVAPVALVVAAVVGGCGKDSREVARPVHDDAAVARDAPAVTTTKPPRKVFVTGAGRCGECHGKMYDEWETSAHAKSVSSPIYVASLANAKDRDTCDHCHAPLGPEGATVTTEGVTCDVCHTLREPKPGGSFRLA